MNKPLHGTLVITSAVAGSALVPAYGSLLVEESFNDTLNPNIGGVQATGTGLTGNGQRSFTDTATATLRTYSTSWSTPAGYGYTASTHGVGTPATETTTAAVVER